MEKKQFLLKIIHAIDKIAIVGGKWILTKAKENMNGKIA